MGGPRVPGLGLGQCCWKDVFSRGVTGTWVGRWEEVCAALGGCAAGMARGWEGALPTPRVPPSLI